MTVRIVVAVALACARAAAQDAAEIVRRSVETDQRMLEQAKDYAYTETRVERDFYAAGRATSTRTETFDTIILYGRAFRKLVARNGAPLSPEERAKEESRLQKAIDRRRAEASNRAAEEAREEKERAEMRKVARELPVSHTLTLLGTETVSGRPVWAIAAEPKPGYKPSSRAAGILWRMRGKLWIDQSDYHWAKLEAEVLDTISFGLVLARLSPGTRIEMEQARVNNEIWGMSRFRARLEARVGLIKKFRRETEIAYRDYRKFQTESRVVAVHGEDGPR